MRNNFVPRLILLSVISLLLITDISAEINLSIVKEGDKIILIRHSSAPGGGDPKGFKIEDCKPQRNLDKVGIKKKKKIGELFKKNFIPIDKVLSSQWCRCKDTARHAFGKYVEFSALNSIFQSPYNRNETIQINQIKKYVKNWNGKGKNLVMVTHYSIITKITNSAPSSGEIVITDKKFRILQRIPTLNLGFLY